MCESKFYTIRVPNFYQINSTVFMRQSNKHPGIQIYIYNISRMGWYHNQCNYFGVNLLRILPTPINMKSAITTAEYRRATFYDRTTLLRFVTQNDYLMNTDRKVFVQGEIKNSCCLRRNKYNSCLGSKQKQPFSGKN